MISSVYSVAVAGLVPDNMGFEFPFVKSININMLRLNWFIVFRTERITINSIHSRVVYN